MIIDLEPSPAAYRRIGLFSVRRGGPANPVNRRAISAQNTSLTLFKPETIRVAAQADVSSSIQYVTKHDRISQTRRFFKLIRPFKVNGPISRHLRELERSARLFRTTRSRGGRAFTGSGVAVGTAVAAPRTRAQPNPPVSAAGESMWRRASNARRFGKWPTRMGPQRAFTFRGDRLHSPND